MGPRGSVRLIIKSFDITSYSSTIERIKQRPQDATGSFLRHRNNPSEIPLHARKPSNTSQYDLTIG